AFVRKASTTNPARNASLTGSPLETMHQLTNIPALEEKVHELLHSEPYSDPKRNTLERLTHLLLEIGFCAEGNEYILRKAEEAKDSARRLYSTKVHQRYEAAQLVFEVSNYVTLAAGCAAIVLK